jgi:thiamine kinase-like enzyme
MQRVLRDSSISVSSTNTEDAKLNRAVELLGKAIQQLHEEAKEFGLDCTSPSPLSSFLPPVLVHMDCQPQNLLFARAKDKRRPLIVSVLDWEEAAFADPRFELLLICRKVCANRSQADQVWKTYREELPQPNLGPIEPWLKLETA